MRPYLEATGSYGTGGNHWNYPHLKPSTGVGGSSEKAALPESANPLERLAATLAAHACGDALIRIAADLRIHHSAVRRVLDAAGGERGRHLLPTG